MVAFSVFLFGYTTLMGWSFYGEQFLEYLFGPRIIMPYRWIYCLLIPLGAIAKGRPRLGLGRHPQRLADLPEPHRPVRPERHRGGVCRTSARQDGEDEPRRLEARVTKTRHW